MTGEVLSAPKGLDANAMYNIPELLLFTIIELPLTLNPLDRKSICLEELLADAAVVLYENDISALPVVSSDDKLVGILTETNVLHTLVKMTGANQPSSQIDVVVPNLSGQLAELSLIFKEKGTNVISVLLFPHKEMDKQVLSFRVQTMDPRRLIAAIEEKGYTVQWPKMPEPGS